MRFIELFAGIGGFGLALERLGHECVYANDIDKYCKLVYDNHFHTKQTTQDIRTVDPYQLPEFDLLCGGFPCQAFSIAGKRRGFEDTRGTLFFEIARIAAVKRPKILFLENVKGLLSHDGGRTFATIIIALDELGYDCQWQVLNSKNFGVPQNRERVFIIGHLRGTPQPKIFPIEGAGPEADGAIVSTALDANYWKGPDKHGQRTLIIARGFEGRATVMEGVSPALRDFGSGGGKTHKLLQLNEAEHFQDRIYSTEGIAPTVPTASTGGNLVPKIAFYPHGNNPGGTKQLPNLRAHSGAPHNEILIPQLRRLTPLECERLQGFPDGWTEGVSDTQRYKMLGNAVTVNVIYEIGRRL